MLDEFLDTILLNASEMMALNAYLAGQVDALRESQGSINRMSQAIANQLSKDIKNAVAPSTAPVLQRVAQVQEDLKRISAPLDQKKFSEEVLSAVSRVSSELKTQQEEMAKRQEEVLKNQSASYAKAIQSVTPLGMEWQSIQPKRRGARKAPAPSPQEQEKVGAPATNSTSTNRASIPAPERARKKPISEEEIKEACQQDENLLFIDLPEGGESMEFMAQVKLALNPRATGIEMVDMRQTARGGVAIRVNSSSDKEKIENLPPFRDGTMSLRTAPKRKPRLLILRVPIENTSETLKDQLIARNQNLGGDWTTVKPLYTIKYGRVREGAVFVSWVVELEPNAWMKAKDQGRVFLDFQTCNVRNFLEVTRCFNCQAYGHTAKAYEMSALGDDQNEAIGGGVRTHPRSGGNSMDAPTSGPSKRPRADEREDIIHPCVEFYFGPAEQILQLVASIQECLRSAEPGLDLDISNELDQHLESIRKLGTKMASQNTYLAGKCASYQEMRNEKMLDKITDAVQKNVKTNSVSPVLKSVNELREQVRIHTADGSGQDRELVLGALASVEKRMEQQATRYSDILKLIGNSPHAGPTQPLQQQSYANAVITGQSSPQIESDLWQPVGRRRVRQAAASNVEGSSRTADQQTIPQVKAQLRASLAERGGPTPGKKNSTVLLAADD
ncbi:hypothetical protein GE061_020228, partial [Apolygus lucorum]